MKKPPKEGPTGQRSGEPPDELKHKLGAIQVGLISSKKCVKASRSSTRSGVLASQAEHEETSKKGLHS